MMLLDSAIVRMSAENQADVLRDILKQEYQLPPALVDTLELQPVAKPTPIRQTDISEANRWLGL